MDRFWYSRIASKLLLLACLFFVGCSATDQGSAPTPNSTPDSQSVDVSPAESKKTESTYKAPYRPTQGFQGKDPFRK